METLLTDDLGLSPEFADPNNIDAFDNESVVVPQGEKSCVCGRPVVRFDVYRVEDADEDGGKVGHVGGIVGVAADGATCCSAFEHYDEAASVRLADEFNGREYVALSQEL